MPLETDRWYAFARDDLRMAELASVEGLNNQTCFHAQQAAEKLLKGLIVAVGHVVPRTHRMADLLAIVPEALDEGMRSDLLLVDRVLHPDALSGCIALEDGLPTADDADGALQTARSLCAWVRKKHDDSRRD